MTTIGIFVSSVQKELNEERIAVRDYINTNPLLRLYFDTFLFEDLPARDCKPDEVYLNKVDGCSIYLGIFGNEYGSENNQGVSPTELEFERATEKSKYRLIFVKGKDDVERHPKMQNLINRATPHVVRKRFINTAELKEELFNALVQFLCDSKIIPSTPFDESTCPGSTLKDLSYEIIEWFVAVARKERHFPLQVDTPPEFVLRHLELLDGTQPTNAAVLLFGSDPQKFLPTAEVNCLHLHGSVIAKPIPSHQVFTGTVFEQVDNATDFVLSKLNRYVPARDETPASETNYEIPKEVINEAIVNAIAHRDYTSSASIQVYVFSDRIEIRNPGELPPDLTFENLKITHNSRPRNLRIANALFLSHYIEKIGYGTLQMIAGCKGAGLPAPDFSQSGSDFVVTLWRDWLTDEVMIKLGITTRQRIAIQLAKDSGRVNSTDYSNRAEISRQTAVRDLKDLIGKGILEKKGVTGKGTYYSLCKGLRKAPYDSESGE